MRSYSNCLKRHCTSHYTCTSSAGIHQCPFRRKFLRQLGRLVHRGKCPKTIRSNLTDMLDSWLTKISCGSALSKTRGIAGGLARKKRPIAAKCWANEKVRKPEKWKMVIWSVGPWFQCIVELFGSQSYVYGLRGSHWETPDFVTDKGRYLLRFILSRFVRGHHIWIFVCYILVVFSCTITLILSGLLIIFPSEL
jgi:hypothetical protein